MLRRKPTRLELKLDDIEEFESIRKDLEASAICSLKAGMSIFFSASVPCNTRPKEVLNISVFSFAIPNVALILKLLYFQTRKKQKEDVDVVGGSDGEGAIGLNSDPKSREQMINDRIGYKPQAKPNNRSSQFGSFEF
ncbi:hypothetical protein QTO34_005227 [Cnephaeus nilssonii]|uniref:Anaphase-promoting complex subunit CDC26 n=1 Tax=Cnephaeus nilssonii TaxID=3371016 RepID=A0AA40HMZ4_CNENI|nr:hypothetical protein QTO34_005227 [Eptesicus nilssonii]